MTGIFIWRYFRGKKSTQAIQWISWISILAIAVGSAALLILLSVFNGFEGLVKELYSDFYPSLKISPMAGKTFKADPELITKLSHIKGISAISQTLEEKVLLTNQDNQTMAVLKGVDTQYMHVTSMQKHIREGDMNFQSPIAVIPVLMGQGIANKLGVRSNNPYPVSCYVLNKPFHNGLELATAYSADWLEVHGLFSLQEETDNQYVFAPLGRVQELCARPHDLSTIELKVQDGLQADQLKEDVQSVLPATLKVETRYEQNKTLFFIFKSERLAVYAILSLMLIIASFNMFGSLTMLVLEKSIDISVLKVMGMPGHRIRNLFIGTGLLLAVIGGGIGCSIGAVVCLLQQHFAWVKFAPDANIIIDAYPVQLHMTDMLLVMGTVMLIGGMASLLPAIRASKRPIHIYLR